MFRSLGSRLRAALALALAAVTVHAGAAVAAPAAAPEATASSARYCMATGGAVVKLNYYDSFRVRHGKPAYMCQYLSDDPSDPFGQAWVEVDTLFSKAPTYAAARYYKGPEPNGDPFPTPAKAYCQRAGGQATLYGYWAVSVDADQYGVCSFEDGSVIEEWTLFYQAAGVPRGIDLGTVFRWNPTD